MRTASVAKAALAIWCALAQAASAASDPIEDSINQHLAAAQNAAGLEYGGLLGRLCISPPGGADAAAGQRQRQTAAAARPATPPPAPVVPPRSEWYQPPAKVFDNLYFVGTSEHNAWVLQTSDGLILIDTLFEWAVRPAMVEGIQKLGLDPKTIKYVIIAHGHADHNQGAKIFQDMGATIVMSAADWDLTLNGRPMPGGNPRRGMEIADGQKITLGDTTVTAYVTPGHTDGTLSLLFPVKDHGQTRVVAYPGGTAFNFPRTVERFARYADTQRRFAKAAADANASILLSNHSQFDDAWHKARIVGTLIPGEPNPFVVPDGVQRYMTVMVECAEVGKARQQQLEAAAAR